MKAGTSLLILALASVLTGGARPGGAAAPVPYFVSLKSDEVYMREGPSTANRIKWIYRRKGLPLEVLAAYDVWRRVRDMDGEIGWIHVALLSRERMAMVMGEENAEVRSREDEASGIVAEAEPGAIGRLAGCGALACEVRFGAADGWIERARLWGVRDGERF